MNVNKSDIVKLIRELEDSNFLRYINSCIEQTRGIGGSMDIEYGQLLYVLVRISKPAVVVETGVANGVSSSFILKALDDNARGRLYSIDLHYREGVAVPLGKELGWVIPWELRNRWSLVLGESTRILPKLLRRLRCIDFFLHDSRHTYKTMMNEYNIVWPYLRYGGLLLSDDVIENDAFIDFADRVKMHFVVVGRMGVIKKVAI
jgi:predicted O-methyltransferase YrrM